MFAIDLLVAVVEGRRFLPSISVIHSRVLSVVQVEYISLKGTSIDNPAVCKYTGTFHTRPSISH